MYKYISISAWLCLWIMARFITWPDKWKTLAWLPNPSAHSWYSLSRIKYKIKNTWLKYYCVACALSSLIIIINIREQDNAFIILSYIVHFLISFWWPSFMALRIKWFYSFIIIVLVFVLNVVIIIHYVTNSLIVVIAIIQEILLLHLIIMNGYCVYILKNPVTHLHYVSRVSRTFNV